MRNWIEYWMIFHAVLLLLATLLFYNTLYLPYLTGLACFSFFSYFITHGIRNRKILFVLEPANIVSTLRLAILFFILVKYQSINYLTITILCTLFLIADGLDGYLARRFKTESNFGAYLDMETDAFYVLSLGAIIYYHELLGAWVLGIGLLRYTYFLVILFFKTPTKKEQRAFRAQFIAVALMISLIFCFISPPFVYTPIIIGTSLMVLYSFGASFWFVLKHQRE